MRKMRLVPFILTSSVFHLRIAPDYPGFGHSDQCRP